METTQRLYWKQPLEDMGWRKRQTKRGDLHISHSPPGWGRALSRVWGKQGSGGGERMGPLWREGREEKGWYLVRRESKGWRWGRKESFEAHE